MPLLTIFPKIRGLYILIYTIQRDNIICMLTKEPIFTWKKCLLGIVVFFSSYQASKMAIYHACHQNFTEMKKKRISGQVFFSNQSSYRADFKDFLHVGSLYRRVVVDAGTIRRIFRRTSQHVGNYKKYVGTSDNHKRGINPLI